MKYLLRNFHGSAYLYLFYVFCDLPKLLPAGTVTGTGVDSFGSSASEVKASSDDVTACVAASSDDVTACVAASSDDVIACVAASSDDVTACVAATCGDVTACGGTVLLFITSTQFWYWFQ